MNTLQVFESPEFGSIGEFPMTRGKLWLLRGNPGTGKTTLALQFALILAEKYRVGYFTLETDASKLADRMALLDIPKECCLDLISASGMTVQDIRAVALREQYEIIFVDYVQRVPSGEKSRYEREKSTSKALQALAQSHGMTVFALSNLPRPAKKEGA